MSRSKWKGSNTIDLKKLKPKDLKKQLARNLKITPNHVELTVEIYNGKEYKELLVSNEMIGHKFGEFIFTRGKFSYKDKKKKKLLLRKKKKKVIKKKKKN